MAGSTPLLPRRALSAIRSTLVGLVVVALLGIVGAVVSYRADVDEAHRQVADRVARAGALYADSLALHLGVLRDELKQLSADPRVLNSAPNPRLLGVQHDGHDMFGGGVALLELDGTPRWSEPPDLLAGSQTLEHQVWFQRALALDDTAIDSLEGPSPRLAIAMPVMRDQREVALLLGVVDADDKLFFGEEQPGEHMLVLAANGAVLLPPKPPQWANAPDFARRMQAGLKTGRAVRDELGGKERFIFATQIGQSTLKMLLIADEEGAIAPIRARLVPQLVFLSLLQLVTLGVFALFLRRQYRESMIIEAAFAQQEKMAALGQAASLIAHEVKNSLNGLNTAAALVEAGTEPRVAVRTVRSQVDRLRHLASSLLSFARPIEPRRVTLRANDIAREAAEGLSALPELAEVSLDAQLDAPVEAVGDPLLLVTALDNLLRNAIEASVSARDVGARTEARVRVRARRENGTAIVEVEDDAGGPPQGFEQTWGEPFSTTKAKGIGLGLAMARKAIEEQGGTLQFTRTARGSRFTIELKGA
ncbi:MAG: GHKL domain-containing protein [Archangiaceae bacterium]|nr:GHKL domain-containing protein [Archangiaceae bacterium]